MNFLIPKLISIIAYLFDLLDNDPMKYNLIMFGIPVGVITLMAIIWIVVNLKNNSKKNAG
jgi:heme/copper-type cytochrome/quinol oxidase subunit 4